jgi:hypothetical protein
MMTRPELRINTAHEFYPFLSGLDTVYCGPDKGSNYVPDEERVFR